MDFVRLPVIETGGMAECGEGCILFSSPISVNRGLLLLPGNLLFSSL